MHMPLRMLVLVLGAVVTLTSAASLTLQAYALNTHSVGSAEYRDLSQNREFIAEIVPPSLNLLQPYAIAMESFVYHRTSENNLQQLETLHAAYLGRKAFWLSSTTLPSDLRSKLNKDVVPDTEAFWSVVMDKLIPAIRDKDQPAIATAGIALKDTFARHQKTMDDLMKLTRVVVQNGEALSESQSQFLKRAGTAVALLSIAFLVGGLALLRKRAILPVLSLASSMRALSEDKLNTVIPYASRRDEIGDMADALAIFRESAIERRRLESEARDTRISAESERVRVQQRAEADAQARLAKATSGLASGLRHLASGTLATKLNEPFSSEFEGLRGDFNQSVEQLGTMLMSISAVAKVIDSTTSEISAGTNDLSRRTEHQAARLEETAAALSDVTRNVGTTSAMADQARSVAIAANQSASQSEAVVDLAISAMSRIEASSQQMSGIISAIDQIAFQTNLLALNAGVEAARAGEAGKGFAVVAHEVRQLAQRSAVAAREVTQLISDSNHEIIIGVNLVKQAGDALRAIGVYIDSMNSQMEEIARSAQLQTSSLTEVNAAIGQMDQVTQQNAAMVEETTAAIAHLAQEASRLTQALSIFSVEHLAA
ncbi:methyl-accepting chemotaxis protein [Rhizobium sp. 57MFTsu3.2]|uniref:methyl-accepting chemotaxis protein n=1 Tax=Rhizobium sp. 57MFTsu3.2 TaxID=1048681 RepID=UPI00146B559F|nr:methyl-accepting chemotaxis protein [Rhizobium sp. 57MFTsu3.2]NMN71557.1 methyl-accepting chemotaxis protein [Rhizobium sp. 57MFTsu3.2]